MAREVTASAPLRVYDMKEIEFYISYHQKPWEKLD